MVPGVEGDQEAEPEWVDRDFSNTPELYNRVIAAETLCGYESIAWPSNNRKVVTRLRLHSRATTARL